MHGTALRFEGLQEINGDFALRCNLTSSPHAASFLECPKIDCGVNRPGHRALVALLSARTISRWFA
jgi:hypothetical protein